MNTAGANIDYKREMVSLKFGHEEMDFHFSKMKNQPCHKEPGEFEEKTIAQLAKIYLWTSKDELERSLTGARSKM